jgi:multidrug efflux system membrane fusion protein
VVSSGPIYASFEGDEETYLRVTELAREGLPVVVKIGLANETGFPHEGKLDFIDNRVDPATGSVRMRATLENDNNALAPGLFASVQLSDGGKAAPAALILDSAVGTDQNHKFVYVLDTENKAVYRNVTLGPLVGGMRVVRHGVATGEKIVVNGLQRVRPGKPVKVQMVQMDLNQTPITTAANDKSHQQLAQSGATGVSQK